VVREIKQAGAWIFGGGVLRQQASIVSTDGDHVWTISPSSVLNLRASWGQFYEFDLRPHAYSISPGFYFAPDDQPRRRRSLAVWRRSVQRMVRSRAAFQYVISFNEWGEGTAVEPAREWPSRSGYGTYLDALHAVP